MIEVEGRTSEAGFSLVEMLVAMTITLIVSGAIYGLMAGGQTAFRREPELSDRQQNARVAMDLIMRDIANAGSGMPTWVQTFKPGLDGPAGGPVSADNVLTDELEMITNANGSDNIPVCVTNGNGNATTMWLAQDLCEPSGCPPSTDIQVPMVVMLIQDDGTYSIRNIMSAAPNSGNPGGQCTGAGPFTKLQFQQGGDPTGLNQPSGVCLAGAGFGTNTTNNNCNVVGIASAEIVHYRIRNDPTTGVPNLQRFSTSTASSIVGGVINANAWQTVAKGIEDLQVRYSTVAAPTTWSTTAGAPVVVNGNYGTLINQVEVTLVARSEARNIQGARTNTATNRTNIRGSLTSIGSPRATLYAMTSAPGPSPKPWY